MAHLPSRRRDHCRAAKTWRALPRTDNEEKYQELRGPDDPATFEEYIEQRTFHPAGRMSDYALQKIIDSPTMGGHLNRMRWSVVTFRKSGTRSLPPTGRLL